MAKKSKLLLALDAHKGRDYEAEKKKKRIKAGEKRKRQKAELAPAENDAASDEDKENIDCIAEPEQKALTTSAQEGDFAAFDSEDEEGGLEDENADEDGTADQNGSSTIPQPATGGDASASEAEQDSDVPLSDLEEDEREDTVPHQRMTINNGPALIASRKRIAVVSDKPKQPFHYHNSLISTLPPASEVVPDPNDDLTRELEFYRIARDATTTARKLLKAEKIPFTRPTDYFAEMVKTDEHMGLVKKKMYDQAAGKKAAEEARKLRDAKKFGKQVQLAKEQERAKDKKDTLNKIKDLKRKRKGTDTGRVNEGDELFQEIGVEDGPSKDRSGRERGGESNSKRQKKDSKYGHGGKKRFAKSGTAESSGDMRDFSAKRMKGRGKPVKRPGKNRRASARS